MDDRNEAASIMEAFAERTGLDSDAPPRRYLWTDAFAVLTFLSLRYANGADRFTELARALVDQVHHVLGRHRPDDPRSGWISGLEDDEGERHPTAGGLRIGKELNERGPDEPYNPRLEWDRDGQYFHYLTRWMLALSRAGRVLDEPTYHRWTLELARAAYAGFSTRGPPGRPRLHWKMSIDLSRPLVPSEGAHDPLDGLITFVSLRAATPPALAGSAAPTLDPEIGELKSMCRGRSWATDDPLGIGGLLSDALRAVRLSAGGHLEWEFTERLLSDTTTSLDAFARRPDLDRPAAHRLAFRELGLAIGLRAVAPLRRELEAADVEHDLARRADALARHATLADRIVGFWSDPTARAATSWKDHLDINAVMLATALEPADYLAA